MCMCVCVSYLYEFTSFRRRCHYSKAKSRLDGAQMTATSKFSHLDFSFHLCYLPRKGEQGTESSVRARSFSCAYQSHNASMLTS